MKNWTKKKWARIFYLFFIYYSLGGVVFYFLQDYILFHPVTLKREHNYNFKQAHKDLSIPINQEEEINLVDFLPGGTVKKGIVLYFHGNKKNISWYADYMPLFTQKGYEVLMIDYPGFGKSKGRLSEKKLYDWALQVYKLAISRYPADSIIIYGKSMGTGIAAELASIRDCKRLILETPYYDFPAVVSHYLPIYPVRWMLHYHIPTHTYLESVTAPVSIFHGNSDWVVSYSNSKKLSREFKPGDELVTIDGGSHNNLFKYDLARKKLDSLLAN